MKYERILVPIEGSERALAALGPARRLAQFHDARLGVLTVAPPETPEGAITPVFQAVHGEAGGTALECSVVRSADPASALVRVIRDEPATLLCLSTQARGPLGRFLFGSVAREVVRRADRPVVLAELRATWRISSPSAGSSCASMGRRKARLFCPGRRNGAPGLACPWFWLGWYTRWWNPARACPRPTSNSTNMVTLGKSPTA